MVTMEFLNSLQFIALILAIADVVTGLTKAYVNKNIESNVFKKGLATHIIAVGGVYLLDCWSGVLHLQAIVYPVTMSVIVMYFISIIENYLELGGTLPDYIAKHIKKKGDTEQ